MKNKFTRTTAILLAVAVSFSANGMEVLAKTVSANEVIVEECTEDTEQDETSEDVIMQEEAVSENMVQVGAGTPANPVHHCNTEDGTRDITTWFYVYFGSFPQSEVTDSATINKIENALQVSQIKGDVGVDVWVDGIKYRRISESDTNFSAYFNEVTNNGYRYFKWERIKWRVLDNNGSTLFVVTDKGLDCKSYNDERVSITWENSTVREWLNNSFYNTAFSSNEQNAVTQTVVNDDNQEYGTEGGNNTMDKVYLLSIAEVTNETYGFCSDCNTYSASRRMQPSNYACARGIYTYGDSSTGNNDNCWWWLRSPGADTDRAANVGYGGYADRYGRYVDYYYDAVLPALHINLSSGIWSITDDGTSGDGGSVNTATPTPKDESENKNEEQSNTETTTSSEQKGTKITGITVTNTSGTSTTTGSFTVTSIDPSNPTVSFDGTDDENAKEVKIPEYITYNGVKYKVTTVSIKSFTERDTAGKYKVTNNKVNSTTVEYTGVSNKKKKAITVPKTVTYKGVKFKVSSVKAKSFKGNKKLTSVKIASSITKIGDSAFEGCTNLKTVTIGTGLKTIGKNAFKNCKKLKTLKIKSSKLKSVGKNAFKGIYKKCKIKVPSKKVKAYKKLMKGKGQKSTVKITK